jgi:hypothetical protein
LRRFLTPAGLASAGAGGPFPAAILVEHVDKDGKARVRPYIIEPPAPWLVARSAVFVDVVEKAHEPLEVGLLVVDVGEVATVRAVMILTIGQLVGHYFQVSRVHGVVLGTDDQGGDVDLWQVRAAVPVLQLLAGTELAGASTGRESKRMARRSPLGCSIVSPMRWHGSKINGDG